MKKEFLTGLTAMVLSIGLALAGCEAPTNGSKGDDGNPGDSYLGGIVLSGTNVSAADLAGAFASTAARQVFAGEVYLASSVATVLGEVPAGRTLNVLGATTKVGDSSIDGAETLTVEGSLVIAEGASLGATATGGTSGILALGDSGKLTVNGLFEPSASFDWTTNVGKISFGAAGAVNAGAVAAANVASVNALLALVPSIATSGDFLTGTSVVTALANLTADKRLVLTGSNALTTALDLTGIEGKIVVSGTLVAADKNISGGAAGVLVVEGTLSATTATLGGSIDLTNGTLSLNGAAGLTGSYGTKVKAIVTTGNSVTTGSTITSVGTITLANNLTLPGLVSLDKLVVTSASPTFSPATGLTTIGTLDVQAAFTIPATVTSIDTITATTAGGALTSTTLATIGTVDLANAVTLPEGPGAGITISAIKGTAAATLGGKLNITSLTISGGGSLIATASTGTTLNPGVYTASGATTLSAAGVLTIGTSLTGSPDITVGSNDLTNLPLPDLKKITSADATVTYGDLTLSTATDFGTYAGDLTLGDITSSSNAITYTFNGGTATIGAITVGAVAGDTLAGSGRWILGGAVTAATGNLIINATGGASLGSSGSIALTARALVIGAGASLSAGGVTFGEGTYTAATYAVTLSATSANAGLTLTSGTDDTGTLSTAAGSIKIPKGKAIAYAAAAPQLGFGGAAAAAVTFLVDADDAADTLVASNGDVTLSATGITGSNPDEGKVATLSFLGLTLKLGIPGVSSAQALAIDAVYLDVNTGTTGTVTVASATAGSDATTVTLKNGARIIGLTGAATEQASVAITGLATGVVPTNLVSVTASSATSAANAANYVGIKSGETTGTIVATASSGSKTVSITKTTVADADLSS